MLFANALILLLARQARFIARRLRIGALRLRDRALRLCLRKLALPRRLLSALRLRLRNCALRRWLWNCPLRRWLWNGALRCWLRYRTLRLRVLLCMLRLRRVLRRLRSRLVLPRRLLLRRLLRLRGWVLIRVSAVVVPLAIVLLRVKWGDARNEHEPGGHADRTNRFHLNTLQSTLPRQANGPKAREARRGTHGAAIATPMPLP
ncbi:MAG TPA: hypothetical protein VGM67_08295 [Gemmatimonadaceae bacterium]